MDILKKYIVALNKKDAKQFAQQHGWILTQWKYITRTQVLIGKSNADIEVYVTPKGLNSSTFELRKTYARLGFMGGMTEQEVIEGPPKGALI